MKLTPRNVEIKLKYVETYSNEDGYYTSCVLLRHIAMSVLLSLFERRWCIKYWIWIIWIRSIVPVDS